MALGSSKRSCLGAGFSLKLLRGAALSKRQFCNMIPLETLCFNPSWFILLRYLPHFIACSAVLVLREKLSMISWDTKTTMLARGRRSSPSLFWVRILALPLPSCMTLDTSLHLAEPVFWALKWEYTTFPTWWLRIKYNHMYKVLNTVPEDSWRQMPLILSGRLRTSRDMEESWAGLATLISPQRPLLFRLREWRICPDISTLKKLQPMALQTQIL